MKELIKIQSELKAPKSQYNAFWKYSYRNVEDIMEALKPLLKENNCVITVSDEIVILWNRFYIKATAEITNWNEIMSATWFAREAEIQKGMNDAQITWSTSSYARKYALNWLFAIDDTKDADSTNDHGKRDWKEELKNCKNWDELKTVFMNSPQTKDIIELKEELKKKFGIT